MVSLQWAGEPPPVLPLGIRSNWNVTGLLAVIRSRGKASGPNDYFRGGEIGDPLEPAITAFHWALSLCYMLNTLQTSCYFTF